MKKEELNITWLYPDVLNLHGDRGNVMALKKVGEMLNLEVNIKRVDSYSQKIDFHENGTVKSIGQTKKGGQAQGTWFYFDENGKLEKTVEYENGNVKK